MGYLHFEKVVMALIILWHTLSDLFGLFFEKIRWLVEHILPELLSHV